MNATVTVTTLLYLAVTAGLGYLGFKQTTNTRDFLLAGRKVVTELIQGDFRAVRLVGEVEALLAGPRRQEVLSGLAEVRARLGPPGASARAAAVVARLMG